MVCGLHFFFFCSDLGVAARISLTISLYLYPSLSLSRVQMVELTALDSFTTPLEKLNCLKNTLVSFSYVRRHPVLKNYLRNFCKCMITHKWLSVGLSMCLSVSMCAYLLGANCCNTFRIYCSFFLVARSWSLMAYRDILVMACWWQEVVRLFAMF